MILVAALAAAGTAWLSFAHRPTLRPASVGPAALVVAGGAAVVTGLAWAGPVLLVGLAVLWGGQLLLRLRARRREAAATAVRVLEVCELLAAEVASGQPPRRALAGVVGTWPALRPVAEAAALGGDVPAAMRELAVIPGAADMRLVGAAWAVAHRTGGGLSDALSRVAATIRADRATRRVVESELASARATARLVAALPVVVAVLGAGSGAGTWSFLVGTPVGLGCLVGGLALGLAGLWWIERIADGVAR